MVSVGKSEMASNKNININFPLEEEKKEESGKETLAWRPEVECLWVWNRW